MRPMGTTRDTGYYLLHNLIVMVLGNGDKISNVFLMLE